MLNIKIIWCLNPMQIQKIKRFSIFAISLILTSIFILSSTPSYADDLAVEVEFWHSVKESNNPDEIRAYLSKSPNGEFAELAKIKLGKFGEKPFKKSDLEEPATVAPEQPTLILEYYVSPKNWACTKTSDEDGTLWKEKFDTEITYFIDDKVIHREFLGVKQRSLRKTIKEVRLSPGNYKAKVSWGCVECPPIAGLIG